MSDLSVCAPEVLAQVGDRSASPEVPRSQDPRTPEVSLLVPKVAMSNDENIRLVRLQPDHFRSYLPLSDHPVSILVFNPEMEVVGDGAVHRLFPSGEPGIVGLAGGESARAALGSEFDPRRPGWLPRLPCATERKKHHDCDCQSEKEPCHQPIPPIGLRNLASRVAGLQLAAPA